MDLRFPEPLLQLAIIQIARDKLFPFDIWLWGYGVGDYGGMGYELWYWGLCGYGAGFLGL